MTRVTNNVSRLDSEDLTDRGGQGHRVTSDLSLGIGRREHAFWRVVMTGLWRILQLMEEGG